MKLNDLEVICGRDLHERVMHYHSVKQDTPVYFLDEPDCWLTIYQDGYNDNGLWHGECNFFGYEFESHVGCTTPEAALTLLMLEVQIYVAREILAA